MMPCIECGEPAEASRCSEHARKHKTTRRGSARSRGYNTAWDRLSRRARALQPFCSDCGTTENLTADHLPSAWLRAAQGKPIRLRDVEVVCGPCNTLRGSSRPAQTQGEGPVEGSSGPRGKAHTPTLSTSRDLEDRVEQPVKDQPKELPADRELIGHGQKVEVVDSQDAFGPNARGNAHTRVVCGAPASSARGDR